jgi:hypothetical protein
MLTARLLTNCSITQRNNTNARENITSVRERLSQGHMQTVGGLLFCGPPCSRGSHAEQVKSNDPDKKGHPGPPGWELGVGLTTPACKTWICLKT